MGATCSCFSFKVKQDALTETIFDSKDELTGRPGGVEEYRDEPLLPDKADRPETPSPFGTVKQASLEAPQRQRPSGQTGRALQFSAKATSSHVADAPTIVQTIEHQLQNMQGSKEEAMEEAEVKLWDKWVNCESPDTFAFLQLATDGGFSEVKDLYTHSRWIGCFVLILFVVYNVYSLISLDCDLIFFRDNASADIGGPVDDIDKQFFLSKGIVDRAWDYLFKSEWSPPSTCVLGALELMWLTYLFINLIYCFFQIACDTGFKRWYHVQYIFWETLPTLSTYSAIKLLNAIVPTVLIAGFLEKITIVQEAVAEGKSKLGPILTVVKLLFSTVVCFVIGFDTFLLKLRVVSGYATKDVTGWGHMKIITDVVLPVIQFLVQVLGVVQLGPFVRKRLFVFIFGGEDGILQNEEVELMDTWNALLVKRMYREYSFAKFIAVTTSFSDEDFQSLVLNEDKATKERDLGK